MSTTTTRTFEEFVHLVRSMYKHPTNRKTIGDTFIHALKGERPDIAEKISGTLFDPSGKTTIHVKVISVVQDLWDTEVVS